MADIIITITHGDPATGILTMTNGPTTNVDQGDQVTWVIAAGSGVAAITGIVEKPMSFDLFNPDPKQLPNSTSWQGTVNPNIGDGQEENLFNQLDNGRHRVAGQRWCRSAEKFRPKIQIKA
ncbi:MAG: hypothetical protein WDO71_08155 [Bacteroidota bacterium]